jgi:hypothetical protein
VDEKFWENLITLIENGNVLPIIGQGVTTIDEDDSPLSSWLSARLAGELELNAEDLPVEFDLNDVFASYLMTGNPGDDAYLDLFNILQNDRPRPGPTLRDLASVAGLKLFITTTPDSLLADALNTVRSDVPEIVEYSPPDPKDTPDRMRNIRDTTVMHILGKAAPASNLFAAWDEDLLEFIFGLKRDLVPNVMPHLSRDLADKDVRILAIGLDFSDWLLRFFLRAARQSRLSSHDLGLTWVSEEKESNKAIANGHSEVTSRSSGINEGDALENKIDDMDQLSDAKSSKNLVMFFGGVAKRVVVLDLAPKDFVKKLKEKWEERHPPKADSGDLSVQRSTTEKCQKGAIFISYASEDNEPASELAKRLKDAGCDVWLDLERLKVGMDFDKRIEGYVIQDCSMFISIISKTTEVGGNKYYHKERNWASERMDGTPDAEKDEFYFPIAVGEIEPRNVEKEPHEFRKITGEKFSKVINDVNFYSRLLELQKKYIEIHV